jgi:hypothetical protein
VARRGHGQFGTGPVLEAEKGTFHTRCRSHETPDGELCSAPDVSPLVLASFSDALRPTVEVSAKPPLPRPTQAQAQAEQQVIQVSGDSSQLEEEDSVSDSWSVAENQDDLPPAT